MEKSSIKISQAYFVLLFIGGSSSGGGKGGGGQRSGNRGDRSAKDGKSGRGADAPAAKDAKSGRSADASTVKDAKGGRGADTSGIFFPLTMTCALFAFAMPWSMSAGNGVWGTCSTPYA